MAEKGCAPGHVCSHRTNTIRYRLCVSPSDAGTCHMGLPFDTGAPSAKYWQDRADEVRAKMDHMHTPMARTVLLELARRYEKLAEEAAKREAEQLLN